MTNLKLANDYFIRCRSRRKVLDLLFRESNYADCIRESQELVELLLKGVLRLLNVDPPHWHDVSGIFEDIKERLPAEFITHLARIRKLSIQLRKDRENAFYGDDDMIPLEVFSKEQAQFYIDEIRWLFNILEKEFKFET